MKLWEKLDKAIKEKKEAEKKLTKVIKLKERDRNGCHKRITLSINDDPILTIHTSFGWLDRVQFDVKYARQVAEAILELLDKE